MGNTPKLRFEGFPDAWEQRKLGEFVTFFSGLTYSPKDIRPSGTLVLRSSNVKDGEVVDADNVYVDPGVVNSENVQDGDIIVVVRNGSRALIGKHAEIKGFKPNTVIGAFMTGIRSEHSSFVNALLNTPRFDSEVAMNMGATINQITGYMFSKMEFLIPDPKEQDAIGDSFRQLDRLITLHQRKCDALTKAKAFYLQNLFPQEREKKPKLRIEKYAGTWQQHRLKEILSFQNGYNGGRESFGSGLPLISVMDVLAPEFITYDSIRGAAQLNEAEQKRYSVEYGDVLFQRSSENHEEAGTTNVYLDIEKKASFGGFVIRGRRKIDYDPVFIKYLLGTPAARHQITARAQGAQHVNVSQETLSDVVICLPELNEQFEIGRVMMDLDTLITRQKRKVEALKTMKKFMLQNMFPQEG